jgi:HNH endonuclease
VPPRLRLLLQTRDEGSCRWPGCDNRRHLAAHHRNHWAHGGETSLDNLILLCHQHHRLVHEGGYTIENGPAGEPRFRNRHGLLHPSIPRPPPGNTDQLIAQNGKAGLTITPKTNQNGDGDHMDLNETIHTLAQIIS